VDWDYETLEQANTIYGEMPAASSNQLAQYFESTTAAIAPAVRRAKVSHMLKKPD
jgi:hypothetical protein